MKPLTSNLDALKSDLLKICKNYISKDEEVVIPEAYIPYIPKNWNGILVLAESQNLSGSNNSTVEILKDFSSEERRERLYHFGDKLRIEPWDDGTLKIAVGAALGVKAAETAVSNAVLWSKVSKKNTNVNPSGSINELSSKLWKEFIQIMQPKRIITAGKIAKTVIGTIEWNQDEKVFWSKRTINLRSASKTYLSRVSGMFNCDDLQMRFPEVNSILAAYEDELENYKVNKIFFACHAVSIINNNCSDL